MTLLLTSYHIILYFILFFSNVLLTETLADFLLGEGKLESFLEEHPPTEINIPLAQEGLVEAKRHLLNAITELGRKVN